VCAVPILFLRAILDQPEIRFPSAVRRCASKQDVTAVFGLLDGPAPINAAAAKRPVPLFVALSIGLDQPDIFTPCAV